jgi:hypothetical protein
MSNGPHPKDQNTQTEDAPGVDPGSVKIPDTTHGRVALHDSQIRGLTLSSVLPSMNGAIEQLRYPEVLLNLLRVGPERPITVLHISDEYPAVVKEAVYEFAKLYSLEVHTKSDDRRDEKFTVFYIYDKQSTQELLPKLKELADAGKLISSAEKFSQLPSMASDFVKVIAQERSSHFLLIDDIVDGRLPASAGLSRERELNPETLDSVKKSVFKAINEASLKGQARSLKALTDDFTDLITNASPRDLMELHRGILLSQYRIYDQALRAVSHQRLVAHGKYDSTKDLLLYAKNGASYSVSSCTSNTFSTVLRLQTDLRVGLDLGQQLEIVEQGLSQWKIASLDRQFVGIQKGRKTTDFYHGKKHAAEQLLEIQDKSEAPLSLLDLANAQFCRGMDEYAQSMVRTLGKISEKLQPSRKREIGDLLFAKWEDSEGYLSFIERQEWAIARILNTTTKALGFSEEATRSFWAGSKILANADILTRHRNALKAEVKPRAQISAAEWQEALKYAETTVAQMKERISAQDSRAEDIEIVLKPRRASSYGYIGEDQELKYQLMADYLTFKKVGLDGRAIGAFLHSGLESMKSGDNSFLDTWQAIGNGIEIKEPGIRARQSHISPFYGPVWQAFGEKCAPDFEVRNVTLPGFVLKINAEGINLMRDFSFLQGEEYKPEIKSWRSLPYRVNAADVASIIKGEVVTEVPYSQIVEYASRSEKSSEVLQK